LPSLAVRIRLRFAPQGILEVRIPFAPPTSPRLRRIIGPERVSSAGFPRFRGVLEQPHARTQAETAERCA